MELRSCCLIGFVLTVLGVGGCATESAPPPETPPSAAHQVGQDKAAIRAVYTARDAAAAAGDAGAWARLFTSNAIVMAANRQSIRGRASIQAWEQTFVDRFRTEGRTIPVEITLAGDYAFCRAHVQGAFVSRKNGRRFDVNGKELSVLERQRDGRWLISHMMGNSNRGRRFSE